MHDVLVKLYVDVLDVLQGGRLDGAIFGFDNAIVAGSAGMGTDRLVTAIRPGGTVTWALSSLECEAYVNIVDLALPAWMEVDHVRANGRDYWQARVIGEPVATTYDVTIEVGRYGRRLVHAGRFGLAPRHLVVPPDLPIAPGSPLRRPGRKRGAP
jgi:hypothetical protein